MPKKGGKDGKKSDKGKKVNRPRMYETLRRRGLSKEKAAKIANSRKKRKK